MLMPVDPRADTLAMALRHACELDVLAFKPGNVSVDSPGHGMTADDFLASAAAIVTPMTARDFTVGARILQSVEATHAAVGCNTNLGIILLCAPLSSAALEAQADESLAQSLARVLAQLSIADAVSAYAAIRIARPGGLGRARKHDTSGTPSVTLREAMAEARERDSIARQYADQFVDLLSTRLLIAQLRRRWNRDEWVVTALYLDLLARYPDSHIVRKHGLDTALRVSHQAAGLSQVVKQSADPALLARHLRQWDEELKRAGLNPGTSADLTVASLYASSIAEMLDLELMAGRTTLHPGANQLWEQSRIPAN